MIDLLLKNVNIEGNDVPVNIAIDDSTIVDRGRNLDYVARQTLDVGGRLLIPGFVESHMHLDIALINSQQIVAFLSKDYLLHHPNTKDIFREAFRIGADVMGDASNLDVDAQGNSDVKAHIEAAFELTMKPGVDLDIHADLNLPRQVELDDLEVVHIFTNEHP